HRARALLRELLVARVPAVGRAVPLDLYAEPLVLVQSPNDLVQNREREVLQGGLVPGEVELLFELQLVALDDDLLVGRATPRLRRAGHVGAAIDLVGDLVLVAIGTEKRL